MPNRRRLNWEAAREQVQVFGMDPDHASDAISGQRPSRGPWSSMWALRPGNFPRPLSAPAPLCTIADISSVWAVGDIYEKDLSGHETWRKS